MDKLTANLIGFTVSILFVLVGIVACSINSVDSYWEEELPCGTSSQGTPISSNQDGSWSDWVECNGY